MIVPDVSETVSSCTSVEKSAVEWPTDCPEDFMVKICNIKGPNSLHLILMSGPKPDGPQARRSGVD